jgi:hypothetical protein
MREILMSAEIMLHGRKVETVFELMGHSENDMTYSLGWAFAQSDSFRRAVLRRLFPKVQNPEPVKVILQEHQSGCGITDIELRGQDVHVIIEAKRDWTLPSTKQLEQYARRFADCRSGCRLVTLSECSGEYAKAHLPASVVDLPVTHISWRDLGQMAFSAGGSHAEKRLLHEFCRYLERTVKMQNQSSNLVYVVSLSGGVPDWASIGWRDFIEKKRIYFHPAGGKRWPKEPPNYIGFRYDGVLQSIHHIDSWQIVTDMDAAVPEISSGNLWDPHYLYALGEPIRPSKIVKTGGIYPSGRIWAMLDLLLTAESISQARDLTQKRLTNR